MKVVYNVRQFGLQLTEDEMKQIAAANKWTLRGRNMKYLPLNSDNTWFNEIDWFLFRSHPLLIELVETDALTNKNLRIKEIPDDAEYDIDTDWDKYEEIVLV
jgi:hypothetical protein